MDVSQDGLLRDDVAYFDRCETFFLRYDFCRLLLSFSLCLSLSLALSLGFGFGFSDLVLILIRRRHRVERTVE